MEILSLLALCWLSVGSLRDQLGLSFSLCLSVSRTARGGRPATIKVKPAVRPAGSANSVAQIGIIIKQKFAFACRPSRMWPITFDLDLDVVLVVVVGASRRRRGRRRCRSNHLTASAATPPVWLVPETTTTTTTSATSGRAITFAAHFSPELCTVFSSPSSSSCSGHPNGSHQRQSARQSAEFI